MEDFRVPKRAVLVNVTRPDGATSQVEVYLSEYAPNHVGGERVSEMLNSGMFLPVRDPGRNKISFLNSSSVVIARVDREVEADDDAAAHTIPTEYEVEVTLTTGKPVQGLLTFVLPPDRARVLDYLKGCPKFIPLIEADRLALINRDYIATIEVLTQ